MLRARRSNVPGAVFHFAARTQGRQPWFTEAIRGAIAGHIARSTAATGAVCLAYAVMPNHLHVVVRQGWRPLVHTVHRILHRAAILARQANGLEGHRLRTPLPRPDVR